MDEKRLREMREGSSFWQITRGVPSPVRTVSQGISELKQRADITKIHEAFEIGLGKAESLKFYDVKDVYSAVKKWIRLPHGSQIERVKFTIKTARSSVQQVQELLMQVEVYLKTYTGETLPREDRPPRIKEKMRSTCVQHVKMMEAVVSALNEFELIFLNRPEKNLLAQQQADEIYETFVSQRTAIYF